MIYLDDFPEKSLTPPPDGYINFDTFTRLHHTRTPAVLNFLDNLDEDQKKRFGQMTPYIDKTGGVSIFISPDQQSFLLENYPSFHIDYAPENYVTITPFAREHLVSQPRILKMIKQLEKTQPEAFGEVKKYKTVKGNIVSYLSPKQQDILERTLENTYPF